MRWLGVVLFILVLPFVFANCDSDQIDINEASLSELDKLSGIGPVKAQAIIDTRKFDSVDDLINVYGIGEITLQKIKDQGLACVNGADEEEDEPEEEDEKEEKSEDESEEDEAKIEEPETVTTGSAVEEENNIISLNPQTIKSNENFEEDSKSAKNKYAMYGLVLFAILIALLFGVKKLNYLKKSGIQ